MPTSKDIKNLFSEIFKPLLTPTINDNYIIVTIDNGNYRTHISFKPEFIYEKIEEIENDSS